MLRLAPDLRSKSFARPLVLGGAVLVALFATTGFFGLRNWQERQAAGLEIEHGRKALATLDRIRATVADLEGERRAYLLTLDPTHIKAYGVRDESLRREAQALQTLVANDPLQGLRAGHLALAISVAVREMDELVKTTRTSGPDPRLAVIRSMDAVRSQIDQMVDHERFRLVHWDLRTGVLEQHRTWLIAAAIVIVTALAGLAAALALLEARRRRKATDENVQLQSDLAERERKIRRLFDSNIIGIVIFGFEGRFIDANDAFLDMVGYTREDLVSGRMRWTDMTPPEWSASGGQIADLRETGTRQAFEKEYFRKDGSRVPVLIGSVALEDAQDQGVAFVLDLTERKRAEEALRESEARYREALTALAHANRVTTMGQLAAAIAHEVNQPITGAVTNAYTALRSLEADPAKARRALDRIVKDGLRAGDIIGRIRALITKAPASSDRFELNQAVIEIIALTRNEAIKHGVSVRTQLAESSPAVEGDRVQLQQVILNLALNGIEAMRGIDAGARELHISTEEDASGAVLVCVRDSGHGIDPSNVQRVFEAFYTTKGEGMGMGLAICRSIIEAHGGRIWAGPNKPCGAVFQFVLPLKPGAPIPVERASQLPVAV
jgi:PAS domain S-box-containing protein